MRLLNKRPFIWPLLIILNPDVVWGKVVIAWGDTIYSENPLQKHEIEHEKIHLKQQAYSKFTGILYIIMYHFSRKFRLECEKEAYKQQMDFIRETEPLERQKIARDSLAKSLSSSLYGRLLTYDEAFSCLG